MDVIAPVAVTSISNLTAPDDVVYSSFPETRIAVLSLVTLVTSISIFAYFASTETPLT